MTTMIETQPIMNATSVDASLKLAIENPAELIVTIEEVNRILEIGCMLLSVLNEEEIQQLKSVPKKICVSFNQLAEIGNTGVS